MPLVSVPTAALKKLVGKSLPREELVAALQALGNDVEDVVEVKLYRCSNCGQVTEVLDLASFNGACAWCSSRAIEEAGTAEVIRISLLPVRPDMFDAAGLARALRGWLGIETGLPVYRPEPSGLRVSVKPGLEEIRPHITACVVRGLVMDDETVKTIMKMQENLHWALGRDRRRASIGVYDLDTVEPDFEYGPVAPDGVKFIPLFGMPEGRVEATPQEILERHPKGVGYKHLLERFAQYPLLSDAAGRVLSMPPIINSEDTRVTQRTRNLLVDVTGPDHNAITRTIAVIAAGLADLGARVESVAVTYPDGRKETTPNLRPQRLSIDPAAVEALIGVKVPDMAAVLGRMRYGAKAESGRLVVEVPAYRADIMHEWDVFEDVAIGYGYANIKPELVPTMTVGSAQPVEEFSTMARRVMTGLGFLETMTPVLTNEREQYELLGRAVPGERVLLANPISVEQTVARENLLTGLLVTLRANTTREMPQAIFECGDCYALDGAAETGVRTLRRLAAAVAGPRAGFADAKQALETLAREAGVEPAFSDTKEPGFIPGRAAAVLVGKKRWGVLGEVHPEVLAAFGITQPVAVFEVELDAVMKGGPDA
jgi:phenylalanyl-tRNA synthetase beta chain